MKRSLPRCAAAMLLALAAAGCRTEMTPLHQAARDGDTAVVKKWIAEKRNLDPRWEEATRGVEGNYARLVDLTPLMLAASSGQLETVKLLVEGGADLYAHANTQLKGDPINAFDFAVTSGHIAVADYLWKKSDGVRLGGRMVRHLSSACTAKCKEGEGTDTGTNMALYLISIASDEVAGGGVGAAACFSQKPLELLAFVEQHARRPPRNTLHCMAYQTDSRHKPFEQRKAVLTWMLDHGADVNGLFYGTSPLRGAAAAHDLDTVKLLVERGANPNSLGNDGLPPIAAAANSCVQVTQADAVDPRIDAQLAMVQFLAPLSDKSVYANPEVLKKGYLIGQCCARKPQAPAQRRMCEVFGL